MVLGEQQHRDVEDEPRGRVRAMTATTDRTIIKERVTPPPARLSLTPAGAVPGLLDGAWWPRSRDLSRELPALMDVLDAYWGRITRVTVNPAHWPVIPRKVPVAGHTVHVGRFADEQDLHKLAVPACASSTTTRAPNDTRTRSSTTPVST